MQRRGGLEALALVCAIGVPAVWAAGCGRAEDTATPVGNIQLTLSRSKVALGSPVDITYKFTVAPGAPSLGTRRVFVHFLDADEDLMWTDDHDPQPPTAEWKPGQTIEYTRTMFVPSYPYVGQSKIVAGVYEAGSNNRLKLSNDDRGDRSYKVADFELLPQTDNIFVIFKDGWHPAEVIAEGATRTEWQWTKKEGTLAFRNPKRDVMLYLQVDNPANTTNGATTATVLLGDQVLTTVPLARITPPVMKVPITAAQLGAGDMVEMRIQSDKTFVPALEPSMKTGDPRELGVRVFHAFIQ
jgi:hypothetical protein